MRLQPGQQPTPEQIAAMQRQLAVDAQKAGMTVPQFVEKLKAQAIAQQQAAQQQQAQAQAQQQQQQQQPINPGPPNPAAIALANFLKGQDLKMRTCILNGQRKDMFKGSSFLSCLGCRVDANISNSQACTTSHPIRCLLQSPQEESPPARSHRPPIPRKLLQAPPSISPCSSRLQSRSPRRTQSCPRSTQAQTDQRALDSQDRATARMPGRPSLRVALRRLPNYAEGVCGRCLDHCICTRPISSLAYEDAPRCLVSEHGHVGLDWTVLRYGNFSTHSIYDHDVCGSAWTLAISEFVRGCWIL